METSASANKMKISIMLRSSDDLETLNSLISVIRKKFGEEVVSVFEAPDSLDYSYPFPIVTVDQSGIKDRRFGSDAMKFLNTLSTDKIYVSSI